MSENNKIGTYRFVAEPFHVDFTGRLTMGVLGNHLLNCAGFHATERGFGIATLNEDNYTWVLSRLAIELDEMPYQYEDFSIQTWVENVYRLFTDRNFAIINKDGKKIGYARSVWAMISLNTRKPADLLALHGVCLEQLAVILAEKDLEKRRALCNTLNNEREAILRDSYELTLRHMERVSRGLSGAIDTSALHLELQSLFNRIVGIIGSAASMDYGTPNDPEPQG